jgi:hypothetical protein
MITLFYVHNAIRNRLNKNLTHLRNICISSLTYYTSQCNLESRTGCHRH